MQRNGQPAFGRRERAHQFFAAAVQQPKSRLDPLGRPIAIELLQIGLRPGARNNLQFVAFQNQRVARFRLTQSELTGAVTSMVATPFLSSAR